MALPWQGDTAFCRSGYDPEYDPYIPTFWPARVPNQVLTEEDYAHGDQCRAAARATRLAAFKRRALWRSRPYHAPRARAEVMMRMNPAFREIF